MSSEEVKTKIGATHRPHDEALKRAMVAPWQSGVPARRVAEGLGITKGSLRPWRRRLAGTPAKPATMTTDRDHAPSVAPNQFGRRAAPPERPDEVWAADLTDVPTTKGGLDLGRRRIVGWAPASTRACI